ncbi:mitogen-activated protein kinase kinase kinase 4, partial [Anoplophora glabripennis]
MSREETLWQNELKDVIWLELQAYHAERTPTEEDAYLCSARECVEPLLKDIQNYRFQRTSRRYSTQNSDSGVEDDCPGCICLHCVSCMEAQNEALRDVETLMKRLEEAESLFPSSQAFAELYPLYNSPEFVGRVKAMCLWYNMTKHQRLKMNILGRLLTLLENKSGDWPILGDDMNSSSPSDSNSSSNSSNNDYSSYSRHSDFFNVAPLAVLTVNKDQINGCLYRRYIENILKTRTLDKGLSFLNRLHQHILKKAMYTLDLPKSQEIYSKVSCDTEEEELQRYGCWSPEAKALNLPSYRATFLFLAMVPLEVIYEYLQMRIDQKPENPSPLSVRQLMRELKEGLRIATEERKRSIEYGKAALSGTNENLQHFLEKRDKFEQCTLKVFTDYLEYVEQWVLLHQNSFQKNFLEEENQFSRSIIEFIPGGEELLVGKFSNILGAILKRIADRLLQRIEHVLEGIPKDNDGILKQTLFSMCRELQSLFNEEREMSLKTMAFLKTCCKMEKVPLSCQKNLKECIISFKCIIPKAIGKVQGLFEHINFASLEESDKVALNSRIREVLMQVYRFGFEFYREMSESTPAEFRYRLVYSMVDFANLWMKFVTERCERGRGMRPRWAYQGMEFLLTVCEPANTVHLTEEKFEKLKKDMDVCISHLIGTTAPSTPESGFHSASPRGLDHIRSRSRGSSPSPRPAYMSQRSGMMKKTSAEQSPCKDFVDAVNLNVAKCRMCGFMGVKWRRGGITSNTWPLVQSLRKEERSGPPAVRIKFPTKIHSEHYREAVETLDAELDNNLRKQNLIGKVLTCNTETRCHIRRKNVTFSWQRGIKIGQGRFGKVYTAVNNNTGDMMAVKEISLQHNDNLTIKRVAEEMKILEGIVHRNLVRYYGVEVHKDEMLIFMEFCEEGTLETLIAATEHGLPELLVRKYTFQLVSGVACLHDHGVVHRDIKTANIFLTEGGNCLKIGDFGCAAKIKCNTTMPGELKGFVGTQAYMAPEVFTRNMTEGHGRAADIWSVGCVVVEMASGERPWHQYDSNYQIMFKVGMGQSPDPPDDMIDEGLDFLELCFKHDPKDRATARELLTHNFVKVGDDLM